MIVLDTNVVSAVMQREPDRVIIDWLDRQPTESVWTTAITVLEVRTGIQLLKSGRRRSELERAFDQLLAEDLESRVHPFDLAAAEAAASLAAARQRSGRPVDVRDIQITGIALARRATLATRNVRHFDVEGLNVINPWQAA